MDTIYTRSDLAAETPEFTKYASREIGKLKIEESVARDGKRAVCVKLEKPWLWCDSEFEISAEHIGKLISAMIENVTGKTSEEMSVLLAGLGNRYITVDSIGVKVAERVMVTANLPNEVRRGELSVIIPGTLSQSGMESAYMIKSAAVVSRADVVIAIDSLAARNVEHLGSLIQITNFGLSPGSGIKNSRIAVSEASVGCPVIAIGVPTVADSATLIFDALTAAEIHEIPPSLEKVINRGRGFFVTSGDLDLVCDELSSLIAKSIDRIFLPETRV